MASQTHSHARTAMRRHPAPESVSTASLPLDEARPEERACPTDVQVWNWAESAVLFGYGPTASNFL